MRQHRSLAAILMLTAILAGCASLLGPRTFTLSEAELAQHIARRFPHEQRVLEVFDLRMAAPDVTLLPEQNRLGIVMDLSLGERFTTRRFPLRLALDSGLRFDAAAGAVTLSDVRVRSLALEGLPTTIAPTLARVAEPLAEQWLEGMAVHRFSADELRSAEGSGYKAGPINVTPRGVEMTLEPARR